MKTNIGLRPLEVLQEFELAINHSEFNELNKLDILESLAYLKSMIMDRWHEQELDLEDRTEQAKEDQAHVDERELEKAEAPSEGFEN